MYICVLEYMSKYLLVLDRETNADIPSQCHTVLQVSLVLYIIFVYQQHACTVLHQILGYATIFFPSDHPFGLKFKFKAEFSCINNNYCIKRGWKDGLALNQNVCIV